MKLVPIALFFIFPVLLFSQYSVELRDEKSDDYEYVVGVNLALALIEVRSNGCSIISGIAQDIRPGGDELVKHIDFFVNDWMTGRREGAKDVLPLVFNTRVSNKAARNEKPFEGVRLEVGRRLIVSYCPETDFTRIALSDESYFPIVKEVIEYDAFDLFEESSDKILDRIKLEKNLIFEGYIIERFSRMGTAGNVNNRAKVLVELLGNKAIPKTGWGRISGQLDYLLSSESDLLPSIREKITEKLVMMGSGRNREEAEQAIALLVSTSQKNKTDIAPFLNDENRTNLIQNYELLVKEKFLPQERTKFEEKLRSKNR